MIGACCRRLQFLLPNCGKLGDSVTLLHCFRKDAIFMRLHSSKSLLVAENDKLVAKDRSFTIAYLINSCGLSPELALWASKKVQLDTRDGPDSVLNLLKDHGFTDAHISFIVKKRPKLLLSNPEKTLKPKLEFFSSVGISGTGLARMLCVNPNLVLNRSLERTIIPFYDIMKTFLPVKHFKVDRFYMGLQRVMMTNILSNVGPNISVLRARGVPEPSIFLWVARRPFVMSVETEKFKENVEEVISFGFCPSSSKTFMKALVAITEVDASERAQKMEIFRKWGWTEDDLFLLAFRKDPVFMRSSAKNFSSKMDFFVNKMGWQPADVAGYPTVLTYSLKKRIIPRCSVIRILQLKGLITKGEFSLSHIMVKTDEYFLDRFVMKYREQVPELLSIVQGKMGLVQLGFGFEDCGKVNHCSQSND